MRRYLFLLWCFCLSLEVSAQIGETSGGKANDPQTALYDFREIVALFVVDSLWQEGMYSQAINRIDSLIVQRKRAINDAPSKALYLRKMNILFLMSKFQDVDKLADECLSIRKDEMSDNDLLAVYNMKAISLENLERYADAIRVYENVILYYEKFGEVGRLGDACCTMAMCYDKLGKDSLAADYYERGFNKYLEYFGTTPEVLMQQEFHVSNPRQQPLLISLSMHLCDMAVFELERGNRLKSKEYLLMSAHTGYKHAKLLYKSVYGSH